MAHKYMGYCPQFDALDELLTGRELLMFYSQVRGISKSDGQRVRVNLISPWTSIPTATDTFT